MTAAGERTTGGFRRSLAFLLVGGLVLLSLAADEGLDAPGDRAAWEPAPAVDDDPLVVPTADTLSAAWYCAEGTAAPDGRADQSVVVANAGETPVRAQISVLRGSEAPVRHEVEVAARSRQVVRVAEIVETPEPGVVVEVFGGDAAVEHQLRGAGGDHATVPCIRRPSERWYFAGGTTVRDARDVLALFNPFEDDAVVDMTFFTEEGIEQPAALQGFVVPARTRVSVPVHEHVLRREVAAAEIVARVGRFVAERSISWDGSEGRQGIGVVAGEREPAEVWTFAEGVVAETVTEDLWIFNPGVADTAVEVQPELEGEAVAEPELVDVPARSARSFRVNDVVGNDVGHSLRVTAVGDADVVVAQELTAVEGAPRPGYSLAGGTTAEATRWLFPAGAADDTFDEWIVVANPGVDDAAVTITVLAGGVLLVPEGLGSLVVPGAGRATFRLGDALKRSDLPVLVESDQPVSVARGLFTATGISVTAGIRFPE